MGIDYLIFGNVDSRDYGILVFFKDIDRTPKRVYERIAIPGRNKEFLLDEKRFEDVPLSYDCVALIDDDRKAFVNALAAQTGYQRMEDSFNPGEFYSAVFEGDVDPRMLPDRDQSTFTINFTRGAERYLTDGESAIDVVSGDTLTNPTLFDARPMLEVTGYGDVHIGDNEITLVNSIIGDIPFSGREYTFNSSATSGVLSVTLTGIADKANTGDTIDVCLNAPVDQFISTQAMITGNIPPGAGTMGPATDAQSTYPNHMVVTETGLPSKSLRFDGTMSGGVTYYVTASLEPFSFVYGTLETKSYSLAWEFLPPFGDDNIVFTTTLTAVYNGTDKITFTLSRTTTNDEYDIYAMTGNFKLATGDIVVHSTKSTLGTPTYIDCDLGEAYMISNGNYISLNSAVQLPAELPTLVAGENEITFDNTVTDLKVRPRWWKV